MVTDLSLWQRLKIVPQYIIPQHLLSGWMYALTRSRWKPLKNLLIRNVIHHYNVDMGIAKEPDHHFYNSFNHFFTRALKAEARPINNDDELLCCPVDGTISQIGNIDHTDIFQAKGQSFNLPDLLAGDEKLSNSFQNGKFATIYLSPRDYHRIHMPIAGQLHKMIYVPGRLFSVNRLTTCCVPQLFSRNERVINIFQTNSGLMAVILVGAIFVGSMETIWAGQITPAKRREITQWGYTDPERTVSLEKGEELGRFNMGSTVILLFEPNKIEWLDGFKADNTVIMGQGIAKIIQF